jgi:uncharacterized protein (DUF362 family)
MSKNSVSKSASRRNFFKTLAAGGIGAALAPFAPGMIYAQDVPAKIPTNIQDALDMPRNGNSLPGKFPGKVVQVSSEKSVVDNQPSKEAAYEMIERGLIELTGEKRIKDAWRVFVHKNDRIGLKVNPIGGKILSTSHEVVQSVIEQLEKSGVPRKNIVIWDRREFQLHEAGFTEENYPGIKITGTERKDSEGSFYDKDGVLYSEKMIDKDWFYHADVEMSYDAYTLPYMVNEGKYSYFTKILTQELDKVINLPIMKNAGTSVTLCLKNLGYGCITNTSRLHGPLWAETSAEVCAFPPVRDKVVLNIADGLKGCFDGGPGANPQFITDYKTILFGTDPVAVDRIGMEIIIGKRIAMGRQQQFLPAGLKQMILASGFGLGVCDLEKINHQFVGLT